jgi:lipopolysaccharide export LptBFGC system permease protein LptF
MASGEPGWLAALDKHSAALVAHQGLAASIVLAVAFAIVAVGVCLPAPVAKATLVLAIVLAAAIWVVGEAFGTILTGGGTDPNSGPLLALLALTYWPLAAPVPRAGRSLADERPGGITA